MPSRWMRETREKEIYQLGTTPLALKNKQIDET